MILKAIASRIIFMLSKNSKTAANPDITPVRTDKSASTTGVTDLNTKNIRAKTPIRLNEPIREISFLDSSDAF